MPVKARDNEFSYPSLSLSLSLRASKFAISASFRLYTFRKRISELPFVFHKEIKYSTARVKFQLCGT